MRLKLMMVHWYWQMGHWDEHGSSQAATWIRMDGGCSLGSGMDGIHEIAGLLFLVPLLIQ